MLDATTWDAIKLWRMFRDGHALPDPGGVLDQSAWLLHAWDEIARAVAREDEERERLRKATS